MEADDQQLGECNVMCPMVHKSLIDIATAGTAFVVRSDDGRSRERNYTDAAADPSVSRISANPNGIRSAHSIVQLNCSLGRDSAEEYTGA